MNPSTHTREPDGRDQGSGEEVRDEVLARPALAPTARELLTGEEKLIHCA